MVDRFSKQDVLRTHKICNTRIPTHATMQYAVTL